MIEPKLCLIPSAYKANKVYSVLPTDGVGDFNFTRASEATRINKDGLIETVGSNVPRLNYPLIDGVVSGCPSLLLEPSRLNLVTYSEAFDNAYWTKEGTSITPNTVISPNGTLNADKLVEDSSNGEHRIYSVSVTTSAAQYTSSVFAKAGERGWISIEAVQGGGRVWFDLINGVVGSNTAPSIGTIKQYPNGWYKCSNTWTDIGGSDNRSFINVCSGDSIISYTGDGTSGVYIWGAQLEEGSYATSYIPTQGSIGTRVAETCGQTVPDGIINSSEGVFFAEIASLVNLNETPTTISISDGTATNFTEFRYDVTLNNLQYYLVVGGVFYLNGLISLTDITDYLKVAIKWKVNDFAIWVNGTEVATATGSVWSANTLDRINFSEPNGTNKFIGNTKQIQYFDTALTDQELAALTKI